MREIPLTHGFIALVDDEDFDRLSAMKWHVGFGKGRVPYAKRSRRGLPPLHMHREVCPPGAGQVVDHINRNTLDNRRENLRACTMAENRAWAADHKNRRITQYRGLKRENGRWRAHLAANGVRYVTSYCEDEAAAARAYDELARKHHGAFARLNFPDEVVS